MKYQRKPAIYDAYKWDGAEEQTNYPDWLVAAESDGKIRFIIGYGKHPMLVVNKGNDESIADPDDYIIRDKDGNLSVMLDCDFKEAFEEITENTQTITIQQCREMVENVKAEILDLLRKHYGG